MSAGVSRARLAGAPISWGVCEVPGWGYQMHPERVLAEMHALGLTATELGPDGFLPADPADREALLRRHGLAAVGAFAPVVLHDDGRDPLRAVAPVLEAVREAGGTVLVLAAATGDDGYDHPRPLDAPAWRRLLVNLDRLVAHAADRGVTAVLHPHVGTHVVSGADISRVLDASRAALCLDTGHVLIGGSDPVELARQAATRIAHAHLKDVDVRLAEQVRSGRLGYAAAVAAGLYRPLGRGDAAVAAVVGALEGGGYRGWYVLEQDTVLSGEPAPGDGPCRDVASSLAFLEGLAV